MALQFRSHRRGSRSFDAVFKWILAILDSRRACVTAQSCARNYLDAITKHAKHEVHIQHTDRRDTLYAKPEHVLFPCRRQTYSDWIGLAIIWSSSCFFCQKTRYFPWNAGTLAYANQVNARIQIRLRDYYLCYYLVDYTFYSRLYSPQVTSHPSASLHPCRVYQTYRLTVPASC
jgi:hypothetical protein